MTGVVYPHINAAKAGERGADQIIYLFALANVARQGQSALRCIHPLLSGGGAAKIPRSEDHVGAFFQKYTRRGFADAHGSASDDHHFVLSSHVVISFN